METKASHLLIGSFVLLMVAGLFGFVIWLAKVEFDQKFNLYYVYFEGSVTGLSTAGEVRYNGVPVGSVTDIVIDPADPRRVRVVVELKARTPVRQDTVASLEFLGITGVSYINLSGGSPESPPLEAAEGQAYPVIASRPSRFEELFMSAPEALERFIVLVAQATRFLSENNRAAIEAILADLKGFTGVLAGRVDEFAAILDNVAETSREMREAAGSIKRATADVETLMDSIETLVGSVDETLAVARGSLAGMDETLTRDLRPLLVDARASLQSVTRTSDEVQGMIAENREAFREFSTEGLFEFSRFLVEARFLVGSLSRLAEKVETSPAEFLFGDTEQGFEAK